MKVIHILDDELEKENVFLKLLLDERLSEDTFCIPKKILNETGRKNDRLQAKRMYELLLRIADAYSIQIEECKETEDEMGDQYEVMSSNEPVSASEAEWEQIRTDCYVAARYKDKLLQASCFESVVESILEESIGRGLQQKTVAFLEKMLIHAEEYDQIADATCPVLIYKGEGICHNVLNVFAEQFGAALELQGQRVEFFDVEEEGVQGLRRYIGKHYRAIIGMQTYLFNIKMKDGKTYLHDKIYAPKYNCIFDHPIWVKKHLIDTPQNFFILTHDKSYIDFAKQYYKKKAYLFPPAGVLMEEYIGEKIYDLSFVGTYGDYWNEVCLIHQMGREQRFLANRFLLIMRKEPDLPAEKAFLQALTYYNRKVSEKQFLELFYQLRRVVYCVMHYYRYRVIKTLLEGGIQVDVFGYSWNQCPLRRYANLKCHPDVTIKESMRVFQQSKLSLNIMSWHKGGFTERMANILLCRTVLVTDATTYLDGRFEPGKDIIAFHLEQVKQLPQCLKNYLEDEENREKIAECGWEKAVNNHTWERRAQSFLSDILMGPE